MRSIRNRRIPVIAFVLPLMLAACGGGEDAEGASADTPADEDDVAENEEWPSQNITWIVVHDPGGGSDADYRRIAPHLEENLGVGVDVEYVTGAGGAVGWAECQAAEPDGYTLCGVYLDTVAMQPLAEDDIGYTFDGFEWISWHSFAPQVLFARAEDPAFASFEEFEADAIASPGAVDIGSGEDFGGSHAIQAALFDEGLETNHVSLGGGAAEVVTSVLGGHLPLGLASMTSAGQAIEDGDLIPLAIFSEERYQDLPDVPTAAELGYDVEAASVWGLGGPRGIPEERLQVVWDAVEVALEDGEVQESIEADGQSTLGLGLSDAESYAGQTHDFAEDMRPLMEETLN